MAAKNFRRVVFTGDILRPDNVDFSISNQVQNTRWLYNILNPFVEASVQKPIEVVTWESGSFNARVFYNLNGLEPSINNWVMLQECEYLSCESFDYIETFFEEAFVIGFEINPVITKIINKIGGTYLDITIHPVRYLDDVFLGFRTNSPDLYRKLLRYNANDRDFYCYAGIHQASISRAGLPSFPDNTAVYVGQTEVDRSLISNGRILEAADFPLDILFSRFDKVLIKRHPLAADPRHEKYLSSMPNCEATDLNLYALMCHPNITTFIGISSGGLTEAQYFGKEVVFLHTPSVKLASSDSEFDPDVFVSINGQFFTDGFWHDIFDSNERSNFELNFRPNRLRHSLNSYWGYEFLNSK